MPKFVDPPMAAWQKALLIPFVLAFALPVVLSSSFRLVALALAVIWFVSWLYEDRRLRRISEARIGEDIGTFAKAFDRRAPGFDPFVIRAVWDALQIYRTHRGGSAPLRPSDNLKSFTDVEDVYELVALEVAERTGRSLENAESNPKYGQVETVADFVLFFWNQPRTGQPKVLCGHAPGNRWQDTPTGT
jgi:hypothetical protein